jgi:hypothetical protein
MAEVEPESENQAMVAGRPYGPVPGSFVGGLALSQLAVPAGPRIVLA